MSVLLDDSAQKCAASCSIEVTVTLGLVLVPDFTARLADANGQVTDTDGNLVGDANAANGVAGFKKLKCNVDYTVTVTLPQAQLARCAANPVLTLTKNVTANDGRFLFVLQPVTALTVTVVRQDGVVLLENVEVAVRTNLDQAAVTSAMLPRNAPTHTFRDIAAGEYYIGVTPQHYVEAEFRIGRTIARRDAGGAETGNDGRAEKVNVLAQHETIVSFVLAPEYTDVQFIGYYIYTGGNYRGSDDPANFNDLMAATEDDLTNRCTMMQAAIEAARRIPQVDTTPETLKVFMAPEFYFRGLMGGYPLETISGILERLKPVTLNNAYRDWLFVFGTAVGYREFTDQSLVRLTTEEVAISLRCSNTVNVESCSLLVEARGVASLTLEFGSVGVQELRQKTQDVICTVNDFSLPANASLVLVNENLRANARFLGKWATLTFTCAPTPAEGWEIRQNGVAGVIESVETENGEHTCTVRIPNGRRFDDGELAILVRPDADTENEIFNVVLIQKGGPTVPASATGGKALKEALVYKEHVSPIDFVPTGEGVELHGAQNITVVPTEGAVISTSPNDPAEFSEVNTSGLGGGSILTIDKVDFGIEVCLDHQQERLQSYYDDGKAKAGEPKIQVHLIPSAGVRIENSPCVRNGWIFNVDNLQCALEKNLAPGRRERQAPTVCAQLQATAGVDTTMFFNTAAGHPGPMGGWLEDENGSIVVYPAGPLPPRETVPDA